MTIMKGSNFADALGILENLIRMGAKVGLTAAGVTAFLKTAEILKQSYIDTKDKKMEMEGNVMYYYCKAAERFS